MTLAARGSCHKASRLDSLYLSSVFCFIQWVAAVNAHFEIIDNTERDNEVKKLKEIIVCITNSSFFELRNMGLQFQRQNEYTRDKVVL